MGLKYILEKLLEIMDNIRIEENKLAIIYGEIQALEIETKENNSKIVNNYEVGKEIMNILKKKDLHLRKRYNLYELRYTKNGYNKSFSAKYLKDAIKKADAFLSEENKKLKAIKSSSDKETNMFTKESNFFNSINFYLETYKKPNIKESSYYGYISKLRANLKDNWLKYKIKDVNSVVIQNKINEMTNEGKTRSLEDIITIFNQFFKYCIENKIITINPMNTISYKKHIRTNGKAIPIEIERNLLNNLKDTKYLPYIALAFYTGLRPNEFNSIKIEENFIIANNSKRKNNITELKKIPITPMLKPYIDSIKQIPTNPIKHIYISNYFSKATNYQFKLYDCRHTFITRCRECGIDVNLVRLWAGQKAPSNDMANTVYTHYDDEYILREAQKVLY